MSHLSCLACWTGHTLWTSAAWPSGEGQHIVNKAGHCQFQGTFCQPLSWSTVNNIGNPELPTMRQESSNKASWEPRAQDVLLRKGILHSRNCSLLWISILIRCYFRSNFNELKTLLKVQPSARAAWQHLGKASNLAIFWGFELALGADPAEALALVPVALCMWHLPGTTARRGNRARSKMATLELREELTLLSELAWISCMLEISEIRDLWEKHKNQSDCVLKGSHCMSYISQCQKFWAEVPLLI